MGELAVMIAVVIPWLWGIALAMGIVSTSVAIVFPPYAWYLVVESFVKPCGG